MSRGVTPNAFSPLTRLPSEAPTGRRTSPLPFSSSTSTLDCGVTTPAGAKGVGHVTAVDRVARTITLDHDPSPGSDWPAVRLTLPVASPHLLEGVAAGTLVEFHIERRAGVAEFAVLRPLSVGRPARQPEPAAKSRPAL